MVRLKISHLFEVWRISRVPPSSSESKQNRLFVAHLYYTISNWRLINVKRRERERERESGLGTFQLSVGTCGESASDWGRVSEWEPDARRLPPVGGYTTTRTRRDNEETEEKRNDNDDNDDAGRAHVTSSRRRGRSSTGLLVITWDISNYLSRLILVVHSTLPVNDIRVYTLFACIQTIYVLPRHIINRHRGHPSLRERPLCFRVSP